MKVSTLDCGFVCCDGVHLSIAHPCEAYYSVVLPDRPNKIEPEAVMLAASSRGLVVCGSRGEKLNIYDCRSKTWLGVLPEGIVECFELGEGFIVRRQYAQNLPLFSYVELAQDGTIAAEQSLNLTPILTEMDKAEDVTWDYWKEAREESEIA